MNVSSVSEDSNTDNSFTLLHSYKLLDNYVRPTRPLKQINTIILFAHPWGRMATFPKGFVSYP
jgi:hypothetical protein